jgi:hypothetical protein
MNPRVTCASSPCSDSLSLLLELLDLLPSGAASLAPDIASSSLSESCAGGSSPSLSPLLPLAALPGRHCCSVDSYGAVGAACCAASASEGASAAGTASAAVGLAAASDAGGSSARQSAARSCVCVSSVRCSEGCDIDAMLRMSSLPMRRFSCSSSSCWSHKAQMSAVHLGHKTASSRRRVMPRHSNSRDISVTCNCWLAGRVGAPPARVAPGGCRLAAASSTDAPAAVTSLLILWNLLTRGEQCLLSQAYDREECTRALHTDSCMQVPAASSSSSSSSTTSSSPDPASASGSSGGATARRRTGAGFVLLTVLQPINQAEQHRSPRSHVTS